MLHYFKKTVTEKKQDLSYCYTLTRKIHHDEAVSDDIWKRAWHFFCEAVKRKRAMRSKYVDCGREVIDRSWRNVKLYANQQKHIQLQSM